MHALLGGKIRDEVEFSAYPFFEETDSEPETAAITPEEVVSPEAIVGETRKLARLEGGGSVPHVSYHEVRSTPC